MKVPLNPINRLFFSHFIHV